MKGRERVSVCERERKKKNWQVFCRNAAGIQDDLDTQIAHLYKEKKTEKDEKSPLKIFITLWSTGREGDLFSHNYYDFYFVRSFINYCIKLINCR